MGDFFMGYYSKNIEILNDRFKDWDDIVKREIYVGKQKNNKAFIIYIDDMVDRDLIENQIIKNLLIDINIPDNSSEMFVESGITTADIKKVKAIDEAVLEVMCGNTLVMFDCIDDFVIISSKGFPKRGVEKPSTEVVIQGPQEAFAESIRINTVLIRRRIRDVNLKCKQIKLGNKSQNDIAIMYMEDTVDKKALKILNERLSKINTDIIYDTGYLEQLIEDNMYSPFPQVQLTERPDKAVSELNEGRICIIVDNSPFVMMVPTVLASFYQSSEDYYQKWEIMSFLRLIRYIAGLAALILPALYIALVVFSPQMLPDSLALKLASDKVGVPFPTVIEIIGMEIVFEALREAGTRMPTNLGGTLGIVGGIIVGQAAVDAGLVSPMVVIIIAMTGVCSFAIPNISLVSAYRLLKYFMIFLAAVGGFGGIIVGLFLVVSHICGLKSFGKNYCEPFTGDSRNSVIKDTLIRIPLKIKR